MFVTYFFVKCVTFFVSIFAVGKLADSIHKNIKDKEKDFYYGTKENKEDVLDA